MKDIIELVQHTSGTRLLGYTVCLVTIILSIGLALYAVARGIREKP